MIAGRYTLDREIGRGGMGAVWLARDEVLGRQVAVKRVGIPPGGSMPDLKRAEREARLAARLSHPHVVAIFDLVTEGEERWLVMEYVAGLTLADLVRRDGALPPNQAAAILGQAADALAAAHQAGIVHRDVKPSNILVGPDGQAKLSDFGIARAEADASLTQTGLVTGSPAYLAPEVASGRVATEASDVWSLGATLFHALTGHPPYEIGDNVIGAMYRIVHEEPPRLPEAGWLAPVLQATMVKDPRQRWPMTRVRDFLLAGPSAPVPRVTPMPGSNEPESSHTQVLAPVGPRPSTRPSTRPSRRPSVLWPMVAIVVLLVAVALIGWVALTGDDDAGAGPATGSSGSRTSASSPKTQSSESSSPASDSPATTTAVTAEGMTNFIADYLATVTSDPETTWSELTPAFQDASGNYGQYKKWWKSIERATLVSADANPDTKQISYRVQYVDQKGQTSDDEVTLQLEGTDGNYRIAGES